MNPFTEEMFVLFMILALGAWIGHWSWRGISLGSAGVLFAALVFGHYGLSVHKAVMDLGLLLFVYSVGLSAGPSFFRTFRKRGMQFVVLATVVVGTGAVVTAVLAYFLRLPLALATGLYAGSLTCTPALAAAIDALNRVLPEAAALASVGYGIAYPYSMIGMVLLIQLLPRLLKRSIKTEEQLWLAEKKIEAPGLQARQFRVTNANIDGQTVVEFNPRRLAQVNISRIKHGEKVSAAKPETSIRSEEHR